MSNFEIAIARLLGNEGSYVNDPRDPGGETNWGISKRSYPNLNIKALTKEQAAALYKRDFWDRIGGDQFPLSVGFQFLDFAVNSGASTAIRALQRAAGCADDGRMGPITMAKLKQAEHHDLVLSFLAERLTFMTNCHNWDAAGKGWTRRIAADMKYAAGDD
jgi:lysozyme family protein